MFIVGNFIAAVARLVDIALTVYLWLIIIRAVLSWVNPDPYNPIVQFLYQITEPVLEPIRKLVPPLGGMIDISMLIAFFGIMILQQILVSMT